MTFLDFLSQLNELTIALAVICITVIIIFFGNKGMEITAKGSKLKIFNKKKKNLIIENALVLEKIIEFAYEISYRRKEAKIKLIMDYTEQMFNEVLTIYEKNFRSDLEDLLKEKEKEIINLERHPDLEMFKVCLELLSVNWRNKSRTFFNSFFDRIDNLNNPEFEKEKEQYVFMLNKGREELLNDMYKDDVGCYTRTIKRTMVFYILKREELQINHVLKQILNHTKTINDRVKLEQEAKRKELEDFLKENLE